MEFLQLFDFLKDVQLSEAVWGVIFALIAWRWGAEWKMVASQGKELIQVYIKAREDGTTTDDEWKLIAQEAFDVIVAIIWAAFRIDIRKRFAKKK